MQPWNWKSKCKASRRCTPSLLDCVQNSVNIAKWINNYSELKVNFTTQIVELKKSIEVISGAMQQLSHLKDDMDDNDRVPEVN